MSGYLKQQWLEEGLILYEKIVMDGLSPDAGTYSLVMYGFLKHGRIDDAEVLFEEMKV